MYLTEYQRVTIDNFMGWWNRESLDDVPPDHASDLRNIAFARKREIQTRGGTGFSRNMPSGGTVIRQFDAAFDNTSLIPLALDTAGNIWRLDNYTVLFHMDGMVDFDALNMNNHVYIAPMRGLGTPFDPAVDVVYVWPYPNSPLRPAAGLRPPVPISVEQFSTGNVGPGWYGAAYSYVYDTGYVSPPSPVRIPLAALPANVSMKIDGFPTVSAGTVPTGVIGFLIYSTKAQATAQDASRAALYEVEYQQDISTVSKTVNFFDTDLVILASADPANGNLLNTMPRLPSGGGYGSVALIKYHGRMIIIGPDITYDPDTAAYSIVRDGRIFVSHPGAPENFDTVTGYLVIDAEFDGNGPRTGFELFGVLYICKAVGTYATQDNGSDPNDPTNPWVVNIIDGGIGAYHHAVGTITGSQPSLSFNSTAFLANRNGLFIFNGNVLRPELSWKIRGLWAKITVGQEYAIRVTIDIFNDVFYVQLPVDDPILGPTVILAADYSLGLDSNNIRWSIYTFPWPVFDIVMAAWPDPVGQSYYFLRLGSNGTIYKLDGHANADEVWQGGVLQRSVPINNYYQTASMVLGDLGSLNICRFVRYRMAGVGTVNTILMDEGETNPTAIAGAVAMPFPGNYKDIGIQTNFTNEKVIVKFGMNAITDSMRVSRLDLFGKKRWPTRPNA